MKQGNRSSTFTDCTQVKLLAVLILFFKSTFMSVFLQEAFQFSSVQLLSHVRLFVTLWTVACQASLSITNPWSLFRLMYIKSVMPSTISSSVVPFSSCLQSFPASGSFLMSQLCASGGQSIGALPSASGLLMNIQG